MVRKRRDYFKKCRVPSAEAARSGATAMWRGYVDVVGLFGFRKLIGTSAKLSKL